MVRFSAAQDVARRGTERPPDSDLPPALRYPVARQAENAKGRNAEQDRADDTHKQRFSAGSAIKVEAGVGKRLHAHDRALTAVLVQSGAGGQHGRRELSGLGSHEVEDIGVGPQLRQKNRVCTDRAALGKLTRPEPLNNTDDGSRRAARTQRGEVPEYVTTGLKCTREPLRHDHATQAGVIIDETMLYQNVFSTEIAPRYQAQAQRIQCVIIDWKHRGHRP